ncbi:TrkH family potassium uptake protein [Histidinibacterium aquaticum]|uniref:TrkH family potassium uptake protein n=1 Tax=Histidinibacterium aquaticum TaxID=2613962 RepID=A0A5J5GFJ5_9RHOB|nr:potassium transporter TrkG [Histidinibacterium aquaticum]KAA9006955.1 TrkH family potassium uptake protein [Histidinibacterium aquaticum]
MGAVPAVPLGVAIAEQSWDMTVALGAPTLLAILAIIATRWIGPPPDLRGIEAVATLSFMFLIVAGALAPAYMVLGMPWVDAAFESVSAITSTGLTVANDPMDWPFAGHVLRAWMQWAGGFAIAVAGVALILGPGRPSQRMGSAGIEQKDLLTSTRLQARSLLTAYIVLTVISCGILILLLPTWWEGLVVGLTAVSTGGFTPRPDSLASYSRAAQIATMLICLSTAVSLMAYVVAKRSGPMAALRQTNALSVILFSLGGACVAAVLAWPEGIVLDAVLNFVSGATTAGFSVATVSQAPPVVALILAGMVVGGGIGSTAGGLKLDRVLILLRTVQFSLRRLRAPERAVTTMRISGRTITERQVIVLSATIFLYTVTAFCCWLAFLIGGVAPLSALFDVTSALSTVGLSSGVTGPDLSGPLKAVLIAAMLLGRLEFLALIAALSPGTWFRRS